MLGDSRLFVPNIACHSNKPRDVVILSLLFHRLCCLRFFMHYNIMNSHACSVFKWFHRKTMSEFENSTNSRRSTSRGGRHRTGARNIFRLYPPARPITYVLPNAIRVVHYMKSDQKKINTCPSFGAVKMRPRVVHRTLRVTLLPFILLSKGEDLGHDVNTRTGSSELVPRDEE